MIYTTFWDIIGQDYFNIINIVMKDGQLLKVHVNKGMTNLPFKVKAKKDLTNWCPITLLNTTYNFFCYSFVVKAPTNLHGASAIV